MTQINITETFSIHSLLRLYQTELSNDESDESSDEESHRSINESSVSDKQGNKSCKLSVEKIQAQKEAFIEIQNHVSVSSDSDNLHERFNEFSTSYPRPQQVL